GFIATKIAAIGRPSRRRICSAEGNDARASFTSVEKSNRISVHRASNQPKTLRSSGFSLFSKYSHASRSAGRVIRRHSNRKGKSRSRDTISVRKRSPPVATNGDRIPSHELLVGILPM